MLIESPVPEDIRAARQAAGLTQTAAGALLHTTCRTWQKWEAGDRQMHPAMWELFCIKCQQLSPVELR
jgi:DNA-binding transcriptional regulator YiaG